MFEGRAHHQMGVVNEETIMIFGGMEQSNYFPTTELSLFTFSKTSHLITFQMSTIFKITSPNSKRLSDG